MERMICLKSQSSYKKQLIVRIIVDIICIFMVAAGILALQYAATPYHRGFFCDDESIKHPVLPDTISAQLDATVGILLPLTIIFIVELLPTRLRVRPYTGSSWLLTTYKAIVAFIFALGVNQFLTDVGKYSIGRLRPHFLTLCDPDYSLLNCSSGAYITDYVCRSTDTAKLKEARLSFPSGHASFSMCAMMFAILYLQGRMHLKHFLLIKPVLQLVLFSMGFFTCLSRISDYMHHWSDVLFGGLLGIIVCIVVVRSVAFFGTNLCSDNAGYCDSSMVKITSDDSHYPSYNSGTTQAQELNTSSSHVVDLNS